MCVCLLQGVPSSDNLEDMPVGLMVRVCKLALKNGFKPYAPVTLKLLPPLPVVTVEPGRLDIRCLEFNKKVGARFVRVSCACPCCTFDADGLLTAACKTRVRAAGRA